ncbi:unnamed protein product [Closterium sp. NIES-64]|nr:unnamed protein product [Closterium sp. NIES-64]
MRAAAVLVIVMSAGSIVAATDWTGIAMKLDPSNQILSTWDSNSDACANPPFKVLNLCCNNIGGVIPDLGRMSNLLAIDLSNNILSDTIPASLGDLPQLKFLELNNNQLSGEIPASIGNLKRLKSISLAHNQLQGRVPKGLNYLRDSPAKYNFSENGYGFCGTGFKGLDTCPGDPPYVSKKSPPKVKPPVKPPVVKPPVVKPPVVKPPVVKPPVVKSPPKVIPPVVKPPPKSPKPSPEKPLPSPSKSPKPSPSAPSASPSNPLPTTSPSPSPAKPSSPPSSPPPSANAPPSSPPPADDPQPVQPLVPLSPPPGSATPSASAPADTLSSGTAAAADSGSSGGNSSASASSSSSSGESSGGMSMGVYIGIAAGGALLVIVGAILIGYCCWWKPKQSRARAAAFRAIRSDKDLNPPSASKRGYGGSKSKGKARSPTGAEAAGGDAGGGSGAAAAAGAAAGAATGSAIAGSGRSSSKKKSPSKRHSPSKHHRIDIESGNNGASGYHSGYHTVDVPPVTVVELPPEPAVRSVREPEAAASAVSATGAAAGAAIAGAGSKSKGRSGKSHSPSPKKDGSRSNPNADKESVGSSPRGDQHDPTAVGGALGSRSIGGSGRSGSDRKTGAAAAAIGAGAAAAAATGSGRSPQTSPHKTRPESPRTRKSGSGSAEPAARDGGRKERKEHTPPKTERGSGNQSGRSPETSPSPKGHKDGSSRRLSHDGGNAAAAAGAPVFEASPPAIPPSVPRNRDSTPPRMPSWSRTGNRNSPSPNGGNRSSSPNRSYHGTPPKPAEPVPILREEGIPTVVEIPVDSDENQIRPGGSSRPVLIPPAVPIPQLKSMPAGAASRKKGGRNGGGAGEDDVSPAPPPNNMRRSGSGDERGEGRAEGGGSGAGMVVGATAVTPKYGAAGRALRVADLEEAGGEAEGEGEDDVVGELRSSSRKGGYGGGRGMGGGGGGMGGRGGVWTPPSGGSGGGADGAPEASDDVAGEGASLERFFTVAELSLATNDFGRQSQRNVLGTGRDGSVYKARLPDGTTVAVKRLTQRNLDQSAREFRFEVESLAHARHPNLVALLGCCAEEDERMLVYEFVPNGSLDSWLHQNSNMEPIDWPMRMHIAIGCARGLSHLHEGLDMKVVHRDVKASNVLLDAQWNPKLGDFAIAKVMGRDQSHAATRVVGTFGYVAPEYMNTGLLTERSDVYSFGVLLLEIISGRKPIDNGAPPDEMDLVTWAKKLSSQERLVEIVDPRLQGMISPDDAEYVLGIAMRCVETNALKRPRMTQIVHMLESEDPKQSIVRDILDITISQAKPLHIACCGVKEAS